MSVPGVTGNAQLLLGSIAGALAGSRAPYRAVEADAPAGVLIVEHDRNGNRYRITVEQIEGSE